MKTHKQSSKQYRNTIQGATYHGQHADSRYRTKINGALALICGEMFEIVTKGDKRVRRKISTTPGYTPTSAVDRVYARDKKTGKPYVLIGHITYCVQVTAITTTTEPPAVVNQPKPEVKDAQTKTPAAKLINGSPAEAETAPPGTDKPASPPLALTDAELTAFKRELEVINVQRAAGLDPNVSISTMEIMSQRSHASIYRDVKKTVLPKPTKIGKRSFFPLSVVLAYTAGQVSGGAA